MVDNVKVIGVPSDFYGEEVGACIILKEGHAFDEKAMKEALGKKLARYKIPSQYIVYDSFPTLGTGKIDAVTLKKDAIDRILNG
jgi:fatty-acyl-CoA synthase